MVLTALVVRLIAVYFAVPGVTDAAGGHANFGYEMGWIARSLAEGRGYSSPFLPLSGPTAMMPPLYPWLLAGIFRLFGVYSSSSAFVVLGLNSVFSALTCVTIYFMARESFGRNTARIAGWIWAVHPFAIYFSSARVWDYAMTGFLLSLCICIAQRLPWSRRLGGWFGFGRLYGLTALGNPAVLSTLPFLLLIVLYTSYKNGKSTRQLVPSAIAVLMGTVVMVLPWTIRTERTMHIFSPVRDNFWQEFWSGNTRDMSDPMPGWTHPASNSTEMSRYLSSGESAYMQQKRSMAIERVRRHPMAFATASLRRIVYYWTGFWSFSPSYRRAEPFEIPNLFFCGGLSLLMLIGAVRAVRHYLHEALPYLVLIAIFPLTYYVTHPLMDYRQPIEPEITILIAAAGVVLKQLVGLRRNLLSATEKHLAATAIKA
jgi:4-amino-4-deoxy-L-arabinose transferase-like glycosyltransferase